MTQLYNFATKSKILCFNITSPFSQSRKLSRQNTTQSVFDTGSAMPRVECQFVQRLVKCQQQEQKKQ